MSCTMDEDLINTLENISISDSDFNIRKLCNSELNRLYTFKDWSGVVFAIRLAEEGFFYTGIEDKVCCYFCHSEKENWSPGDKAKLVHKKLNANCPLIVNRSETNNIPIYSNLLEEPLLPAFQRISHLLVEPNVEQDRDSARFAERDNPPVISRSRRSMSYTSDATPGSNSFPGGSRDSSIGSSGSRDSGRGRSNSQEGVSSEQPPQRLSGPQPAVASLPRSHSGGITSPQNETLSSVPSQLQGNPSFLRYEKNRLDTFREFPPTANVRPNDLARAGFIYTGTGDRVQCVFCRGILRDWDIGEKPHIEHKNKFPTCPFILGFNVGNVRMTPIQPAHRINVGGGSSNQSLGHMEALGINTDRPKHTNYAVESTRMTSFNNWPQYKHQTPQQLAAAGFFYAGFGDNVKCFYCDGGLRNWEPGDDPWSEHARWFPRCSFVRTVKGDQFIRDTQERFSHLNNTPEHQVEPREVRARMELPMVRAVLETGVSRSSVMQVIERRLRETGDDFPTAEALLNAVLTLEENPGALNVSSSHDLGAMDIPPDIPPDIPLDITSSPPDPSPTRAIQRPPNTGETSSNRTVETGSKDLVEENRLLREQKTCKICLDAEVGVVFLPCGHLCCCVMCAPAVRQCPICRADIRGTVRTFIP